MTFWLDTTAPRAAHRAVTSSQPVEPEPGRPLFVEPLVAPPRSLGLSTRRHKRRDLATALVVALAVHLGLVALLCRSTSKERFALPLEAESGAIFASLTPASSITPEPSAQPPTAETSAQQLEHSNASPQTFMNGSSALPLAHPDIPNPLQSAEVDQATLNTGAVKSEHPAPVNASSENPWTHASVAAQEPTLSERLWNAIEPCWRDGGSGSASLRLVLDDGGHVQSMTDLEGGDALANPKAQPLAQAVVACAPYGRLVTTAGSYLIVAPS